MPMSHAVLALLANGPSHGYELKRSFEQAVGPQWGALNIGQLYQVLERLSRDGLVTSEREPSPGRPDRVVHSLTEAGREELGEWYDVPSRRAGGARDDFFLKLVSATRSGDQALVRRVVERQRTFLLRELHNLETLAQHPADDVAATLVVAAARLHVRAELEFVDVADHELIERPAAEPRPALAPPKRAPLPRIQRASNG